MMGIEIANPSYPKNSIVIEVESNLYYGFVDQVRLSNFIKSKIGYTYNGYRNSYTIKLIANTMDISSIDDTSNYQITKIKQSGIKQLTVSTYISSEIDGSLVIKNNESANVIISIDTTLQFNSSGETKCILIFTLKKNE